jgi:hypothetical protein
MKGHGKKSAGMKKKPGTVSSMIKTGTTMNKPTGRK